MGRRPGLQVWGNGNGPDGESLDWDFHEWLFDIVWANCKGPWESFRGLRLACEIEWKTDERSNLQDFCKLTVCRADCRLFVFGCKPDESDLRFDLFEGFRHAVAGVYLTVAVPDGWDSPEPLPSRRWTVG